MQNDIFREFNECFKRHKIFINYSIVKKDMMHAFFRNREVIIGWMYY